MARKSKAGTVEFGRSLETDSPAISIFEIQEAGSDTADARAQIKCPVKFTSRQRFQVSTTKRERILKVFPPLLDAEMVGRTSPRLRTFHQSRRLAGMGQPRLSVRQARKIAPSSSRPAGAGRNCAHRRNHPRLPTAQTDRSEEHTSELQSR